MLLQYLTMENLKTHSVNGVKMTMNVLIQKYSIRMKRSRSFNSLMKIAKSTHLID